MTVSADVQLPVGTLQCQCSKARHAPNLVVLTGGSGGGKTAIFVHEIDDRLRVWRKSSDHFLEKAASALEAIRALVPQCCLTTPISFK